MGKRSFVTVELFFSYRIRLLNMNDYPILRLNAEISTFTENVN